MLPSIFGESLFDDFLIFLLKELPEVMIRCTESTVRTL